MGGNILITLRRRDAHIELCVADDGPGIPEDQRDKVFQRLYRADPSRSSAGNGLGLSLVRAVVLLHDGYCQIVDNAPGARVILSLPVAIDSRLS